MLNFQNISIAFHGQPVLQDFSLHIGQGKIYTIFGPNGCGKSTLMNILAGLIKPQNGVVHGFANLQGKIGYVFQDYRRHLLPWQTARQNILFPLALKHVPMAEQTARLNALLKLVPVSFDLDVAVLGLSGGQAQLVSLLRALIINPTLLILDEPFSALDYHTTMALRQTLLAVHKAYSLTVICISHDLDEALYLGDEVVFLTARPAHVQQQLAITCSTQRNQVWTTTPEFGSYKQQALALLNA